MFGIGWPEFLLIVVVTVIVIGPDELPRVLRQAGKFMHKLRTMSRSLQDAVDEAVREAEIEEITRKANEPYMKEIQYQLGGPPEQGEALPGAEDEEPSIVPKPAVQKAAPKKAVSKKKAPAKKKTATKKTTKKKAPAKKKAGGGDD